MAKIQVLKDELTNDPLGRGYSGMTDLQVKDSMNAVDRPQNKQLMSASEIFETFVAADYIALTGDSLTRVNHLLSFAQAGGLNPFGNAEAVIIDAFGTPSATVTALGAARVVNISRGTEVGWGWVREGHIARAHT